MFKRILCVLFIGGLLLYPRMIDAAIYVSTTGNDGNSGTASTPLRTVAAAIAKVNAGDSIIVRSGTFPCSTTISITKAGTSASRYYLVAYFGEHVTLDFSSMTVASGNQGIKISGSYWFIKGFGVKGAGDNGMLFQGGSNNRVEFCEFYENRDAGCQLKGGAANNQIINCDSYYNMDPGEGNADGFAPKMDVGSGNYFYGCRAWQNSDDGWDGYLRGGDDVTTTLENCWCYRNGFRKNGSASTGNGNGFKMGGSDDKDLKHNVILKNCLAVSSRVKGFDQNNNKGSMTIYNATAYNNGTNYKIDGTILASGKSLNVTNSISAGLGAVSLTGGTITTCSWLSGFTVSNADFQSLDTALMIGQRKADGSLPDITFMHLKAGSKLIDAGTVISGIAFAGSKPDLGCFETGLSTPVQSHNVLSEKISRMTVRRLSGRNLVVVSVDGATPGMYSLSLYDISGRYVNAKKSVLLHNGNNEISIGISKKSTGTYIVQLRGKNYNECQKVSW